MPNWRLHPSYATVLCILLLFGGLVVDLNTDRALVVAIIYAIPIALSGLVVSRTLTWWCIALALLANVGAGYGNAVSSGGMDTVTIFNRVLAGMSFLLVGLMTLLLEATSEEVQELADAEEDSAREHELRQFLLDLSGPLEPDELMTRAVVELRRLLHADAVVVTGLDGDRFADPRWADPVRTDLARPGTAASWAVDAMPITANPVIGVRSDQGLMSVGKWRCHVGPDLVVLAARPTTRWAARLLGEALTVLVPIRERAVELERARQEQGPVDMSRVPGPPVGPEPDDTGVPTSPEDDGVRDATRSGTTSGGDR